MEKRTFVKFKKILFLAPILLQIVNKCVATSKMFGELTPDDDNVPLTSVQSVAGMLTNLPCNITPSLPGDRVNLVLWYKDGFGKPLFSFDLRGEIQDPDGKIWANPGENYVDEDSSYRAQLHTKSAPTAVLSLLGITSNDAGTYRCRVDFKRSPTRYWKVHLSVIVPPTKALILDEKGAVVQGTIGPFNELSTLILTCDVIGGWPMSRVTWWRNGDLIDNVFEEIAPGKSRNTMKVEVLKREDAAAEFTCLGNNNNDTQPVTNTVKISLNLRPTHVELLWDGSPMSVNNEYELKCQTFGSQPSSVITWWINGDQQRKAEKNEISKDGNVTLSTLKFRPRMEDHGRKIACRAENPLLPNSLKFDEKVLEVFYPPVVSLTLGSKLDASDIKEGDDVYFECKIKSHPKVQKVTWKKDGAELLPGRNLLINEYSLVIQSVNRSSAGKYVCVAFNEAGTGSSDQVLLDVKYAPICGRQGQGIGVGRNEEARVVCQVDANPPPRRFHWQFNTSSQVMSVPPENVIVDGSVSVASYKPKTEMDYGTLLCWGDNELGRQAVPCVFHIIPAGKPDMVKDCQVSNKTFTSIYVECLPGYDGGLKQSFVIAVFPQSVYDEYMKRRSTSTTPVDGSTNLGDVTASYSGVVVTEMADYEEYDSTATTSSGASSPVSWKEDSFDPIKSGLIPITQLEMPNLPIFAVDGLPHGTGFSLAVYAKNSKGKSDPFLLRAYTLKSAERQVDPEAARDPTKRSEHRVIPVLWIVFGLTGLLTLIAIVILIVIRPRCSPGSGRSGSSIVTSGYGSSDERSRKKNPANKNGLKIDLNMMGSYPGVGNESLKKNSKKAKFRTSTSLTSPNHHEMETNPDLIPKQGGVIPDVDDEEELPLTQGISFRRDVSNGQHHMHHYHPQMNKPGSYNSMTFNHHRLPQQQFGPTCAHHQQQQPHQHQQQQLPQLPQRKSLCFEDVQFRHPHLINSSSVHQHTLAPSEQRIVNQNLSYTTLPRNLNAGLPRNMNTGLPRSAIKLVQFRPINNGQPTHEGNELHSNGNDVTYAQLNINSISNPVPNHEPGLVGATVYASIDHCSHNGQGQSRRETETPPAPPQFADDLPRGDETRGFVMTTTTMPSAVSTSQADTSRGTSTFSPIMEPQVSFSSSQPLAIHLEDDSAMNLTRF